jgi:biotin transport system substrate-specific component
MPARKIDALARHRLSLTGFDRIKNLTRSLYLVVLPKRITGATFPENALFCLVAFPKRITGATYPGNALFCLVAFPKRITGATYPGNALWLAPGDRADYEQVATKSEFLRHHEVKQMASGTTNPNTPPRNQPMAINAIAGSGIARYAGLALLAVAGSVVLWVSAKTQVPFFPVPMTLQTLAIMGIAAAYGSRLGLATIALYLVEGAFGLPVFSGTPERGIGLAYMMGPTAGYLAGFVVATWFVGWFAERGADKSTLKLFAVMLAGAAIVLAMGWAWLGAIMGYQAAWQVGVVPFVLGDLVKVAIAALAITAAGQTLRWLK